MKKPKSNISVKPFKSGRSTAFHVSLIGEGGGGVSTCLNKRELGRLFKAVRNTLSKRLHELEVKALSNGVTRAEQAEARQLFDILRTR
jgi:hypothetical protein